MKTQPSTEHFSVDKGVDKEREPSNESKLSPEQQIVSRAYRYLIEQLTKTGQEATYTRTSQSSAISRIHRTWREKQRILIQGLISTGFLETLEVLAGTHLGSKVGHESGEGLPTAPFPQNIKGAKVIQIPVPDALSFRWGRDTTNFFLVFPLVINHLITSLRLNTDPTLIYYPDLWSTALISSAVGIIGTFHLFIEALLSQKHKMLEIFKAALEHYNKDPTQFASYIIAAQKPAEKGREHSRSELKAPSAAELEGLKYTFQHFSKLATTSKRSSPTSTTNKRRREELLKRGLASLKKLWSEDSNGLSFSREEATWASIFIVSSAWLSQQEALQKIVEDAPTILKGYHPLPPSKGIRRLVSLLAIEIGLVVQPSGLKITPGTNLNEILRNSMEIFLFYLPIIITVIFANVPYYAKIYGRNKIRLRTNQHENE